MRKRSIAPLMIAVFFLSADFMPSRRAAVFGLSIHPVFNGQALILKQKAYLTAPGDSVYIDAFRFYISDLRLLCGNVQVTIDPKHHLIDAKDPASLELQVQGMAAGTTLTGISFEIGVDSLSNVSGAMGGDLDPAKGMYWAWNSGYVNARLEGRSSACHTLHHAFEFHIGGYRLPYNTRRKVTLLFKRTVAGDAAIALEANAGAWFTQVHLKDLNSVVMPSKEAMTMADNYSKMFSVAE